MYQVTLVFGDVTVIIGVAAEIVKVVLLWSTLHAGGVAVVPS